MWSRKNSSILFFLGGVLLAFSFFSCGPSTECLKNDDCTGSTKFCNDGQCVQCRNDSDCTKEEHCQNNICLKKKIDEPLAKEKIEEISIEKEPISEEKEPIVEETFREETSIKEEIPFEDAGDMAEEPVAEEMLTEEISKEKIPESCSKGMVLWQNQCYTAEEYCKKRFSNIAQKHIDSLYEVIYDNSGEPTFCKTAPGSYYLPGQGYSFCDQDADGWITLEAYRAYTSLDKAIKANARCHLLTIKAIVYHIDNPNAKGQIQLLKQPIPLIETYRNDGGGNLIERPIYTQNQRPIPKNKGNACQKDSDCKIADGELCYIGYCLKAKRFQPAEINTLTKACIKNGDLNDNQLDDATETPSDDPTPKTEFKPLLKLGYFVELNYGYYQKDYNIGGGAQIPVFHIVERSRRVASEQRGLALNCGQAPQGNQVDYWKYCYLKDDQRCKSSNGQFKKGLSECLFEKIHHATRSLFKCVVFDGQKDASQYYFHPNNFGLSKKYTRATCSLKGSLKLSAKNQHDVEFSCSLDKKTPDVSKDEVGWACVSFHHYGNPKDYLAGCIDECTESKKVSGAALPCGENDHCNLIKNSYGKGKFACKTGQKGQCADGTNYCKWGKFDTCIAGKKPKEETCNGFDDDCDGQIDEDKNGQPLSKICLPKHGCHQNGSKITCHSPCKAGKKICAVGHWQPCTGVVEPKGEELCNGIDDDCDGKTDEPWPKLGKKCTVGQMHCQRSGVYRCTIDKKGMECSVKPATQPESCNGRDDDCNGRIDEGCPTKLNTIFSTKEYLKIAKVTSSLCKYSPWVVCPAGYVWTGLKFTTYNNKITLIYPYCHKWALKTDKTKQPYQYSVSIYKEKIGDRCGNSMFTGSYLYILRCPSNKVIVGIEGNQSSNSIHGLKLHCAKLSIKGSTPKHYKMEYGSVSKTSFGGLSSSSSFYKRCPQGYKANRLLIYYSGYKNISGMRFECHKLIVSQ